MDRQTDVTKLTGRISQFHGQASKRNHYAMWKLSLARLRFWNASDEALGQPSSVTYAIWLDQNRTLNVLTCMHITSHHYTDTLAHYETINHIAFQTSTHVDLERKCEKYEVRIYVTWLNTNRNTLHSSCAIRSLMQVAEERQQETHNCQDWAKMYGNKSNWPHEGESYLKRISSSRYIEL